MYKDRARFVIWIQVLLVRAVFSAGMSVVQTQNALTGNYQIPDRFLSKTRFVMGTVTHTEKTAMPFIFKLKVRY